MRRPGRGSSAGIDRRDVLKSGAGAVGLAALWPYGAWAQGVKRGGTLRVSSGGDPPDYDVHQTATYLTQHVCAPCYSTLLRVDPADYNKLIPDLAERYEVSGDGRTVTFQLRTGVTFHNGQPLTADDIAFSLDRIRTPPRGIVSPRRGLLENIERIEARGPTLVVITLKAPQPDFPFMVSNPFNVIVSKAVTEPLDAQGTGLKRQIMGTGPFQFGRAVDGQLLELSRFEKYYAGPVPLERVQFFPIRGEVERGAALQGRRIDACFFFASEAVLTTLRQAAGITALRRPTPTFINLIPNVQRKPFDDPRVREALSLAVDRDAFIKTVGPLAGAFYHSLGLMPPGSPLNLSADEMKQIAGYDTLPGLGGSIEANRKRAVELLEQAGVPKGFKVGILARGDIPAFRDSSITIAAQLKAIGFDTTVDVRDAGAFYNLETKGEFQLVTHSVAVAGALPDQILGEGYTSFGGRNYGQWKDDALDALYRQQSRETDAAKRSALIAQFQRAFLKTNYQINLAWVGYGAAHLNSVKGWQALPDLYANMQLDRVGIDA